MFCFQVCITQVAFFKLKLKNKCVEHNILTVTCISFWSGIPPQGLDQFFCVPLQGASFCQRGVCATLQTLQNPTVCTNRDKQNSPGFVRFCHVTTDNSRCLMGLKTGSESRGQYIHTSQHRTRRKVMLFVLDIFGNVECRKKQNRLDRIVLRWYVLQMPGEFQSS